jgi:hypothetical protein
MRNLVRMGAMKLKRFSEEQIALRLAESGATVEEIYRNKEISAPAFITGRGFTAAWRNRDPRT